MTNDDCKFLKIILAFSSNISLLKIFLVKLIITNFPLAKNRFNIAGGVQISSPKSSLLNMLLQCCFVKLQLL